MMRAFSIPPGSSSELYLDVGLDVFVHRVICRPGLIETQDPEDLLMPWLVDNMAGTEVSPHREPSHEIKKTQFFNSARGT
jgi:hypothetical protein